MVCKPTLNIFLLIHTNLFPLSVIRRRNSRTSLDTYEEINHSSQPTHKIIGAWTNIEIIRRLHQSNLVTYGTQLLSLERINLTSSYTHLCNLLHRGHAWNMDAAIFKQVDNKCLHLQYSKESVHNYQRGKGLQDLLQ